MPLRAYCEERFRITVSLGPGSAVGEKGKKRGQIGKISAGEATRAREKTKRQARTLITVVVLWLVHVS